MLSPQSYHYRYPPHHRSYPIANPRSGAAAAPDSSHARRRGHEGVHGSLAATCSRAVAVQGDVEAPAMHSNAGTHGAGHACVGTRTGHTPAPLSRLKSPAMSPSPLPPWQPCSRPPPRRAPSGRWFSTSVLILGAADA